MRRAGSDISMQIMLSDSLRNNRSNGFPMDSENLKKKKKKGATGEGSVE